MSQDNRYDPLPWWNFRDSPTKNKEFMGAIQDSSKWKNWWRRMFLSKEVRIFVVEYDAGKDAPVVNSSNEILVYTVDVFFKEFPASNCSREEFDEFVDFVYCFLSGEPFEIPWLPDGKLYKNAREYSGSVMRYI